MTLQPCAARHTCGWAAGSTPRCPRNPSGRAFNAHKSLMRLSPLFHPTVEPCAPARLSPRGTNDLVLARAVRLSIESCWTGYSRGVPELQLGAVWGQRARCLSVRFHARGTRPAPGTQLSWELCFLHLYCSVYGLENPPSISTCKIWLLLSEPKLAVARRLFLLPFGVAPHPFFHPVCGWRDGLSPLQGALP